MARGVFPGDLEEAVVRAEPLQTGVPAAVHLRQQPGLQADTPGLDAHAGRTGSERGFAQTAETVLEHEPLLTLRSFELITVISEKLSRNGFLIELFHSARVHEHRYMTACARWADGLTWPGPVLVQSLRAVFLLCGVTSANKQRKEQKQTNRGRRSAEGPEKSPETNSSSVRSHDVKLT